MDFLQLTLFSNAIFSSVSGLVLMLFHKTIGHWFGRQRTTVFWATGLGLIGFASFVYSTKEHLDSDRVWTIIILDIIWVLASFALLTFEAFAISKRGKYSIGSVAVIVLLLALGQFLALR